MKKQGLWVSFKGHLSNGMIMAADGLFEGRWPLDMSTLLMLKMRIREQLDEAAAKIKAIDGKGAIILSAPKIVVQNIELCCIAPSEIEVADEPANDAPKPVVDAEAQKA